MLGLFNKEKIIFLIGDDGAVVTYMNGNKVEKRLFAKSAALSDRREVNAFLNQHPNALIYLMLDTMEQSYTKQTLPAVGSMALGKLIKKRLDRDFSKNDIKGALSVGREEKGRRDWIYMFAATPVTPALSDWIEYINDLENKFVGIYMLPVEMQNFAVRLNKALNPDVKKEKKPKKSKKEAASNESVAPIEESEALPEESADIVDEEAISKKWQLIITNNKTGGFRQVVLQDDKVVFTRLIKHGKENLPDIIAGNIEQETLNTIDYLRRLSFGDSETIDVIAVVANDIKNSLSKAEIKGHNVSVYTPYEIAQIFKLENAASQEDKFCDTLIAAYFATSKDVLKLSRPEIEKATLLYNVLNLATVTVSLAVPVFILYSAYTLYFIISTNSKIGDLEDEKAQIEKKWRNAQQTGDYEIDEANKILDAIAMHNLLDNEITPFDLIKKVSVDHKNVAPTNSILWNYGRTTSSGRLGGQVSDNVTATINMVFTNTGNSIEDLFKNYDKFTSSLRGGGNEYEIKVSELPDQVTFENKANTIDVKVTIESKKEDQR